MKTVTEDFTAVQAKPDAIFTRQVYYKRRYWNQATRTYVWEASWTLLPESQIISISAINWNLDTEQLNEFKVSNVTITVDNSDNRWRPGNPTGFFKQDAISPIYGYEPYWTKFQIKAGYELASGSTETVPLFVGLSTEFNLTSGGKTCQISLEGLESFLLNNNAEQIATTVTQENAGTGDGSDTTFVTLNPGVGGVTLVSLDGVTQVEGQHYTVSNLNSASLGATVTFTTPPDLGDVVRITYFYWPQTKKFEELVALLLTAAGISSGDQLIEPVSFANSVQNAQVFTSQADWDSGTKTGVETVSGPGALRVDWGNSVFKTATNWSQSMSGWDEGSGFDPWSSDGTWLIAVMTSTYGGSVPFDHRMNSLSHSDARNKGTWEFVYQFTTLPVTGVVYLGFTFMGGVPFVQIETTSTTSGIRIDNSFVNLSPAFVSITRDTNPHTVKIIRYGTGLIEVYWDGVFKHSVTSASNVTDPDLSLSFVGTASASIKVKEIAVPAEEAEVNWVSPTIDFGATPTAWGTLDQEVEDAGDDITYQTRTSTDGISWDAYEDLSAQNLPQSALKRYMQVKIKILGNTTQFNPYPEVLEIVVRAVTSTVNVTLPAFTGLSVYEALQKIGEFTNYEYGFTPDEDFFFRPKSTGAAVLDLHQSNYVSAVISMDSGYERVYGIVRATYGSITKELTNAGDFAESQVARVAKKRFEISPDSNLQIPASADIASGVASSFFAFLSKPRKRIKVQTKLLPQLDLSDAVTLTLINNLPDRPWYLGDDTVYLGQEGIHLFGENDQFAYEMPAKVIAARYDTTQRTCEFELEEIL